MTQLTTYLTYLRKKYNRWTDNKWWNDPRLKRRKEQRFLKKHHCETWEQYHRKYDPDYYIRASRIVDIYHGYPYIYCFESRNHPIYDWDIYLDGTFIITEWCKENCSGKFRFDFQRVLKAPSTSNEWQICEMGGGDYIFAAFKNETDYTLFLLRWA